MISVRATVPQIPDEARTLTVVCSSSTGAVLMTVSGGMMDLGWATPAAPSLVAVVEAHLSSHAVGNTMALAEALTAELTTLERDNEWLCTVEFVLVTRAESGGRFQVGRIGAARVFAVRGGTARVVGVEDAVTLPGGVGPFTTAALTASVRWRVGDPPAPWVLERNEASADGLAAVCVDDIELADECVVVVDPRMPKLRADDVSRLASTSPLDALPGALLMVTTATSDPEVP
jgi:hypothetical protein